MIFWWICRGESGLRILFLCHLRTTPLNFILTHTHVCIHTHTHTHTHARMPFPGGAVVSNLPVNAGDASDVSSIPGLERSPGLGNGNYSSIFAWKTPWTEEKVGYTHGVAKSQTQLSIHASNIHIAYCKCIALYQKSILMLFIDLYFGFSIGLLTYFSFYYCLPLCVLLSHHND